MERDRSQEEMLKLTRALADEQDEPCRLEEPHDFLSDLGRVGRLSRDGYSPLASMLLMAETDDSSSLYLPLPPSSST
jgi:hypothetical protein